MRVAICDDEKFFVEQLYNKIVAYSVKQNIDIFIDKFYTTDELFPEVERFDIIFLDIRFDGKNTGIEWAKTLRKKGCNTLIVICSSLSNQLIHGYEIEAVRFLLKPISDAALHTALNACLQKLKGNSKPLIVKSNYENIVISTPNIVCIESINRQRIIRLVNHSTITTLEPLQDLYQKLDSSCFQYTHQSFIVQIDKISRFERQTIQVVTGQTIPLSKKYSPTIQNALFYFMEGPPQ